MPVCPYCKHDKFVIRELDLDHEKYDLVAVCCGACDAVIAVTEPYTLGKTMTNINQALKDLVGVLKMTGG